MAKKGLCITCINDKNCTFLRRSPVLQCEEFSDYESPKPKKFKKVRQEKIKFCEEPVAFE